MAGNRRWFNRGISLASFNRVGIDRLLEGILMDHHEPAPVDLTVELMQDEVGINEVNSGAEEERASFEDDDPYKRHIAPCRTPGTPDPRLKTIAQLMFEVHDLNYAKGWFDERRSFGDMIALAHSEVSEMLEAYRKWKLADGTAAGCAVHEDCVTHMSKPEGVKAEAADVFIRLLDMCYRYDIDLPAEYERKMAYNWTRPYKHGGRTL